MNADIYLTWDARGDICTRKTAETQELLDKFRNLNVEVVAYDDAC